MPVLIDAGEHLRNRLSGKDNNSAFVLPLLVFVDRDFRLVRERGFNRDEASDFVTKKSAVIELLRAGKLPSMPPLAAQSLKDAAGGTKQITFRFAQSKALTDEARARLREHLKSTFPAASEPELDAMMGKVDEAASTGGEARLESQ